MDPIREALKLKLQLSPRLPDPNDSNSSSASVLIPKLFDMGFNHQKQSSLNPARSKGFSIDKQGYNRDSRSDSISASNSPRPTVSPRGLGELPVQMNPAHTHSQRLNDANKVLRFFAYFKEVMIFSNVESERVRKCIILFYLADGSMEIVEEKVPNSGIEGGVFLKRAHIPNSTTNAPFHQNDFTVGADVNVFGRNFRIYDCDSYTRQSQNIEGRSEIPPDDEFTVLANTPRKPKTSNSSASHSKTTPRKHKWLKSTANMELKVREAAKHSNFLLRKPEEEDGSSSSVGAGATGAEDFTSILRYYAKWVDNSEDGDNGALYKIHFYLEDGSLEIMVANGKDLKFQLYPVLLNRQMTAKEVDVLVSGIGNNQRSYLTEDDLIVGSTLTISNRKMLIYGADERTYSWVEANKGIDMRGSEVDITPPVPEPIPVLPQLDEDGNEIYVEPVVDEGPKLSAKEQFFKQAHLAGKILRFKAKIPLDLRHPADVDQIFVISYYLADDTISVFCRSPPNSGLTSGQFLSRAAHKNVETGKRFTTEELFLGARLQFRSRTLEIDAVDDYSMAYTHMSLPEILGLLRQKIQEKNVNLHETFRSYDDDHSQGLTYDEFHDALRGTNLNLEDLLTKRDVLSLFRHFDKDNSGLISYLEFCNGIQEANPFDAQMDSNYVNPHEQFTVSKMTEEEIEEYIHKIHQNELDGRKEIDLDNAMIKFVQFTHSHRNAGHMTSLFMDFDENGDGHVSMEEFGNVLREKIHLSRRDVEIVKLKFFPFETENIQFDNFIMAVKQYTDAKKKGKFLGGYKPPSIKGNTAKAGLEDMKSLLCG